MPDSIPPKTKKLILIYHINFLFHSEKNYYFFVSLLLLEKLNDHQLNFKLYQVF